MPCDSNGSLFRERKMLGVGAAGKESLEWEEEWGLYVSVSLAFVAKSI